MFDAAVPALLSYLAPFYELNREITRSGNRHVVGGATPYNNFRCLDGYVAIMYVSNEHWLDLCRLMDRGDLLATERWHNVPERADDWRQIEAEVEKWTSTRRRDDVAHAVAATGIPSAPVRTLPEVGSDPHLFQRQVVREVTYAPRGTVKVIGNPIKLGNHTEPDLSAPPTIGQHTDELLQRLLGLQPAEINDLRRAGVI